MCMLKHGYGVLGIPEPLLWQLSRYDMDVVCCVFWNLSHVMCMLQDGCCVLSILEHFPRDVHAVRQMWCAGYSGTSPKRCACCETDVVCSVFYGILLVELLEPLLWQVSCYNMDVVCWVFWNISYENISRVVGFRTGKLILISNVQTLLVTFEYYI
jgi:hypothetical protein